MDWHFEEPLSRATSHRRLYPYPGLPPRFEGCPKSNTRTTAECGSNHATSVPLPDQAILFSPLWPTAVHLCTCACERLEQTTRMFHVQRWYEVVSLADSAPSAARGVPRSALPAGEAEGGAEACSGGGW